MLIFLFFFYGGKGLVGGFAMGFPFGERCSVDKGPGLGEDDV